MIGLRSRTTSPSSVTSSRSTPCVAGWCGPMFRVSSSVDGSSEATRSTGAIVIDSSSLRYSDVLSTE